MQTPRRISHAQSMPSQASQRPQGSVLPN